MVSVFFNMWLINTDVVVEEQSSRLSPKLERERESEVKLQEQSWEDEKGIEQKDSLYANAVHPLRLPTALTEIPLSAEAHCVAPL